MEGSVIFIPAKTKKGNFDKQKKPLSTVKKGIILLILNKKIIPNYSGWKILLAPLSSCLFYQQVYITNFLKID